MDMFMAQSAVEVLRAVWEHTQKGHVVTFTQGMGMDMIISVDDAHTASLTHGMFSDMSYEEWLKANILGTYRALVTGEGLSWSSPEK